MKTSREYYSYEEIEKIMLPKDFENKSTDILREDPEKYGNLIASQMLNNIGSKIKSSRN